jgi:hypothetical protein
LETVFAGDIRLMVPIGILGLTKPDGNPGRRAIDYYIEKGKGRCDLIKIRLYLTMGLLTANKIRNILLVTND